MSKTLKLDTLKGFKPKGVNVDKDIIDGALRELKKEESLRSSTSNLDKGVSLMEDKYRLEIKRLKAENEKLKTRSASFSEFSQVEPRKLRNNLAKLVEAIKVEASLQGTKWPILSTNKLRKTYKVTADSFKDCLAHALSEGLIDRKEKSYSGNVTTWSYTVIK